MNKILKNKKNIIKSHFPENKQMWKLYFKKTLPVVLAELVFASTSFVDNFMVTHIPNGVNSLSYANTWTGIISTFFMTINTIAAMLVGQFYGAKNYKSLNQIMALRVWTYVSIATIFALCAWIIPTQMISFVGPGDVDALEGGVNYIRFIAIAWILLAIAWNTNGLLNETGHSLHAFFTACFNIAINVLINSILIYGLKLGVEAAAYGTIAAVFISIILDCLWMYLKKKEIWINPKNLFFISSQVAKMFFKRSFAFAIAIAGMIVLPLRMIIWNYAYQENGIGEQWMKMPVSSVLALTESISMVFSATTAACGANVSVFVATNLGKNDFDEAKKHAAALKGFHATTGAISSSLLLVFIVVIWTTDLLSSGISKNIKTFYNTKSLEEIQSLMKNSPFWNTLSETTMQNKDLLINAAAKYTASMHTRNLAITLITVALVNPLWSWFYTTSALIASGGRSTVSSVTTLVAQWSQFIFLIIIGFVFIKNFHWSLPVAYFIFYSWDIIRLIIYESVQYNVEWKRNIQHELNFDSKEKELQRLKRENLRLKKQYKNVQKEYHEVLLKSWSKNDKNNENK
ncbi:MATE family efflux transporter [[Mycoplasma] gypis]|uniref:Probable multidrug resistance protein NorM n=1 Tax=[Mycoplasma] gypis TaxID=92404 RepID=A0ABZ2RMM4_9BACT|nr:MATE family efflux transporter [[Mycoplasma] gypis]MBN0919670.1 MATE family efflux transporter [[Mycoplasma] gypis]